MIFIQVQLLAYQHAIDFLFDSTGMMPHGYCFLWNPSLLWTFVISNIVTALSYFSIPLALGFFAYKRKDVNLKWILPLFSLFIFACGITHVLSVVTIWKPVYGLSAIAEAFTAIVSVLTAVLLWPLIPKALRIPTPSSLLLANKELESEIIYHKETKEQLRQLNTELDRLVELKTNELQKSETLLRLSQIIGGIGSWEVDLVNNKQSWSENCNAMFGFPNLSEATWGDFIGAVHSEDRQIVIDAAQLRTDPNISNEVDYRIVTASGNTKWMRSTWKVKYNTEAKPIVMRGIVQDITEQILADKRIAYSETLFHSLFENMSSGVVIYSAVDEGADFILKDINHSVELLESIWRPDVIGKRVTTVFPAIKEFGLFAVLQRVLRTGEPERFPISFYQDNRIKGWRDNYIYRLPSGEVIAIYDDVTARKQAEIALSESHEKTQSLLQSMAEGAYGVDINGYCTFVNKSFLKILGYEHADEIIGKHIHELTHHSYADGSHYPAAQCQMHSAYHYNAEIHCANEVFWHKDGKAIPVEYWSQPIVTDGVMMGAIATFIDITERKKAEENIQTAALYSRSLIEASLDPLVTISVEGKITDANAASEKVTGINRDQLIGSDFADYFTEPEKAREGYRQVFSQGVVTDYPLTIRHVSGKITDVLYNATLYRDSNDKILGVFAAARDVTERKAAEVKLRMLSTAIEQSPASVVITNLDSEIQYVNPRFTQVTGYSLADVIGKNQRILESGLTKEIVYDAMWDKLLKGQPWVGEFINQRKNGEIYYEEAYISPVQEDDGTVSNYVAVKLDVTARKQMEEEVRQLAFYDPLTKLPNRRLLNDRLSQVLSASKRSGCYSVVIFLDLDNFKPLNDAHGHVVGDLLLIEAANRLVSCIREMDTVARFGGDEFVVMLAELDDNKVISISQAEIVAEKIQVTLSEPYVFTITHDAQPDTTVEHRCTVSMGVMVFNGNEGTQEDIMKWADAAMYEAKDAGRNFIRFYGGKCSGLQT